MFQSAEELIQYFPQCVEANKTLLFLSSGVFHCGLRISTAVTPGSNICKELWPIRTLLRTALQQPISLQFCTRWLMQSWKALSQQPSSAASPTSPPTVSSEPQNISWWLWVPHACCHGNHRKWSFTLSLYAGLKVEGVYRRCGLATKVKQLVEALMTSPNSAPLEKDEQGVLDASSALKQFIREKQSLIPNTDRRQWQQAAGMRKHQILRGTASIL